SIPDELTFDLIEHPWFQRLRRIKQLGMTQLVYPGALHTRFHHALGAMHLMQLAIESLRLKGLQITNEEAAGAYMAILLHDIGHGPYSHALEKSIVAATSHEDLSVLFMQALNKQFDNKLLIALAIFNNTYPKHFLHQLVASQLDMDRLDYLKRDSFFTGVSEGVISTDRIIKMLNVHNDELVVEAKGIYSIEKFIIARRLMYWQVYYHKTVVGAEQLIINILQRAKWLAENKIPLFAPPILAKFLSKSYNLSSFLSNPGLLDEFAKLDDFDILTSIKVWCEHEDPILSVLSKFLINRRLFAVDIRNHEFSPEEIEQLKNKVCDQYVIKPLDSTYFVISGTITNNAYDPARDKIRLLYKNDQTIDIAEASDQLNISILSRVVSKHYICYPKDLNLP
ncbi:MAG: HD domain-containing protein, partial [Bacteroidales bacterium]|nr:HD domain-containing protein [Bacteroidales bacterium]